MTGARAKPRTSVGIRIRAARASDLRRIQAIYGHHVEYGLASFELAPPTLAEMTRRRRAILAQGLPYLVAEFDSGAAAGAVQGFAHAGLYRTRPAYRHTVEDSLYVDPDRARRGLGRALLEALIRDCTELGYRQMVAVIGDSGNLDSIRLHQALGFARTGTLRAVGFKFGRWVDCVILQRALGAGDTASPKSGSLPLRAAKITSRQGPKRPSSTAARRSRRSAERSDRDRSSSFKLLQ